MTGVQTCALPICFPVTIADVDIIILTDKDTREGVKEAFIRLADEVIIKGEMKTSIFVQKFRIDLTLIIDPIEWGGCLFHSIGPKEFNILNRQIAQSKGWLLNDKGLWNAEVRIDDGTEEGICEKLNVPWAPSVLRELIGQIGYSPLVEV